MSNVIVISHRRSGTHFTIDSLINNFDVFNNVGAIGDLTIDNYTEKKIGYSEEKLQALKAATNDKPLVFKSHSNSNIDSFFGRNFEASNGYIKELFSSAKLIYVYRDGRDVMTSSYFYQKKFSEKVANQSFSDFIRAKNNNDAYSYSGSHTRVGYWAYHVSSWLNNNDVLPLTFEELKSDFSKSITKISEFINIKPNNKLLDVSMEKSDQNVLRANSQVKRSSVSFRKGASGDWVNCFNKSDLDFFNSEVESICPSLLTTYRDKDV